MSELPKEQQRFLLGQRPSVPKKIFEGTFFAVFVNKVDVAVCLNDFNELDHIDVIFKHPQNLYFIASQLAQFADLLELCQGYHFYGYLNPGVDMYRPVDLSVLPLPDVLSQRVVVYYFYHRRYPINYKLSNTTRLAFQK